MAERGRWAASIHTLGAMAAEHVFYGENSSGVGGDLQSATQARPGWSARGAWARAARPERREVRRRDRGGDARADHEAVREDRAAPDEPHARQRRLRRRPGRVGARRTRTSARLPRRSSARRTSPRTNFIASQQGRGRADRGRGASRRARCTATSSYSLLDAQQLRKPEIDWTKEETWPRI